MILQLSELLSIYPKVWESTVPRTYQAVTCGAFLLLIGLGIYMKVLIDQVDQVS